MEERGGGDDAGGVLAARRVVLAREDIRRVGPLIIEPARRLVRHRDGRSVTLEPRTMQVLVALMAADGAILSRDDLIQSCWEGRIVGDDSIGSVVYRLRRDLRDIGDGVLQVETITKVGFRLVRGPLAAAAPAVEEPWPAETALSPAATAPRSWPGGRPSKAAIFAGVLSLGLAAAAGWWAMRSGPAEAPPVSIGPIAVVGAGLEPTLPAAFGDALRGTLGDFGIPIATREAGLRLSTALRRSGAGVEATAGLDDANAGRNLWTQTYHLPTLDEHAAGGLANRIAEVVKCGLPAIRERGPPNIVALMFRICATDDAGTSLARSRELQAAAPGYAFAQIAVATSAAAMILHPSADEAAVRREGLAAADRTIALRPKLADGYVWRALLTPYQQAAARERMLREALAKPSDFCACAPEFLGDFLAQTGRLQEALALFQEGYDRSPSTPPPLNRLIRGLDYVGQHARAETLLDRYEALHGPSPELRYTHRLHLEHGDRSVGRKPYGDPAMERAAGLALPAIESGDAAARANAAAFVRTIPVTRTYESSLAAMLSELGDTAGALAVVETSRRAGQGFAGPGRYPGIVSALLWDPRLRNLWSDPGFPAYLKTAGFFVYWRATHSAPDVCRTGSAPLFCAARL